MKSLTAVCQTGASMPAINPNGRINRHPPHRGDGENAEMKMYLSKLKDLVPFMPKNRKLSKLEIIQHVIDYICDLQSELETHPEINNFDAEAALQLTANMSRMTQAMQEGGYDNDSEDDEEEDDDNSMSMAAQERLASAVDGTHNTQQARQHQSSPAVQQRQPLVDRPAPNTILPATAQQQQFNRQLSNTAPASNTTTNTSSQSSSSSSSSSSSLQATSSTAAAAASSSLPHIAENGFDTRQPC